MNETLIIGNSTINLFDYNNGFIQDTIKLEDVLKDVCEQWNGYTYNSHLFYGKLLIIAFIFIQLNRFIKIKLPTVLIGDIFKKYIPEYEPKNNIMKKIMNWSFSDEFYLFHFIGMFFYDFVIWYIIYTCLTQFLFVEHLTFFEMILKILRS